ncbi:MAG: type II secretion system protein [Rhizomicrobium sp.]
MKRHIPGILKFALTASPLHLPANAVVHPTCEDGHADYGFTLMEVLVALAILAISLGVLLGIFSQALDRVREGEIKANANNLAKTLLLRAETADPSEIKDTEGVSDPGLRWRIHIQDYGSEQDRTNWPQRAVQVSTIVSWKDHGRDRSITLAAMRLLPKNTKNE